MVNFYKICLFIKLRAPRGGVAVVNLSPIKGSRCFLEQESLPSLLSTRCFKERILNMRSKVIRFSTAPPSYIEIS